MFRKSYYFFFRCIALLSFDVLKSIVLPLTPAHQSNPIHFETYNGIPCSTFYSLDKLFLVSDKKNTKQNQMANSMQILETRVMKTCHCNVILNTLSNAIVCLRHAFPHNFPTKWRHIIVNNCDELIRLLLK